MGEGSGGRFPPALSSQRKPGPKRERSEGFFLWGRLLINAIYNETRLVPGVLSVGLVEGDVCLWGTPDPACARSQLHLTLLQRSRCLLVLPVPAGHQVPVGREAEAVGIPAQVSAPQWAGMQLPRGWNCLGVLGSGFEAGPGMAWGQLKSLAELPPSHVFRTGGVIWDG